jgi:hypothetical protein
MMSQGILIYSIGTIFLVCQRRLLDLLSTRRDHSYGYIGQAVKAIQQIEESCSNKKYMCHHDCTFGFHHVEAKSFNFYFNRYYSDQIYF